MERKQILVSSQQLDAKKQYFYTFIQQLKQANVLNQPIQNEDIRAYFYQKHSLHEITFEAIHQIYQNYLTPFYSFKFNVLERTKWPADLRLLGVWLIAKNVQLSGISIYEFTPHLEILSNVFLDRGESHLKMLYSQTIKQTKPKILQEEKRFLNQLVNEINGKRKWFRIAEQMQERFQKYNFNPKQLRQYWSNNLRMKDIDPAWTKEEDLTLLRELITKRKNWAKIRERIPSKTPLYIKNRFNKIQKAIDRFYKVQFKKDTYTQEEWEKVLNVYIKIIKEQPDEISRKLNFYYSRSQRHPRKKEDEVKQEQIEIKEELKTQLEQDKQLYERIIHQKLHNSFCLFSPGNVDVQNYMRLLMDQEDDVKVEEPDQGQQEVPNKPILGFINPNPVPFKQTSFMSPSIFIRNDKQEVMYFTPQSLYLQSGFNLLQNPTLQSQKFNWSQEEVDKEMKKNEVKDHPNEEPKSNADSLKQSLQIQKQVLLEQLAECFIKKEIIKNSQEKDK